MIEPTNHQEAQYTLTLAAHLVRAQEQLDAGDIVGSDLLSAAVRDLATAGVKLYGPRTRGLIDYAELLADEQPRSGRLTRFLGQQQDRMLAATAPEPEPEDEPIVPVKTRRTRARKKE